MENCYQLYLIYHYDLNNELPTTSLYRFLKIIRQHTSKIKKEVNEKLFFATSNTNLNNKIYIIKDLVVIKEYFIKIKSNYE